MRGSMDWKSISARVLEEGAVDRAEALAVLRSSDDELLALLDAAFAVRRRHFGRGVRLHVLRNARSGGCSEDCGYCSQSAKANPGAARYPWQSLEEILAGAREAHAMKAVRYCVVASGRAPTDSELDAICETVRAVKAAVPIDLCLSLGLLTPAKARRLKDAGVNRYNHNLETSARHFPSLCTTHTHAERVATAKAAKAAGIELCCGGLVGAGETLEDRVDLAFELREVCPDSIPVNFLDPRPGPRSRDASASCRPTPSAPWRCSGSCIRPPRFASPADARPAWGRPRSWRCTPRTRCSRPGT